MYSRHHRSMPNPPVPTHRPDSRTIFQQNQAQFQQSIACNHRGPNGVLYSGEICEICFCRMNDVPLEEPPLNLPRSQTVPGTPSSSPLDLVGSPPWVRQALTLDKAVTQFMQNRSFANVNLVENNSINIVDNENTAPHASGYATDTVGSRLFDADPIDIDSTRSDPRRVLRLPVTRPDFAGVDTIARLNDDPVRLDDMAFGGDFGTWRSNGTRRMKFDPPVKPLSMKSIEKKGVIGFLKRAFGRKRT